MQTTWEEFEEDTLTMLLNMKTYKPDVIVPIMNGGMVPGAILAEKLSIRDVRPINIFREGDNRIIEYGLQGDIEGLDLLIVEDGVITAKGPVQAKKVYELEGARVKIASVYTTPQCADFIDFYGRRAHTLPDLPWKPARTGDRI